MKAEESILGPEPYFKATPTDIEMIKTLNWYNYFYGTEDSKKWVIQWLKSKKVIIDDIAKVPHEKFPLWLGVICRQLSRGSTLSSEWVEKLNKKVADLELLSHINKTVPIIIEKFDEKRDNLSTHIETLLDQFYNNGYKLFDHKLLEWIKENNFSKKTTLEVSIKYLELKEELDLYDSKSEGYSRLTEKQYTDYKKFVKSILEAIISYCEDKTIASQPRKPRKPRKKKEKSPIQLTKNVKYLTEYDKIKSIDPTVIIGAQSVWFYNTKYKVLTKLESDGKLSIKGTTIIGFNEKTSEAKRIRKPTEVLQKVLSGGKIILRKLFSELRTKNVTPKGRLNADTIILRVIK